MQRGEGIWYLSVLEPKVLPPNSLLIESSGMIHPEEGEALSLQVVYATAAVQKTVNGLAVH